MKRPVAEAAFAGARQRLIIERAIGPRLAQQIKSAASFHPTLLGLVGPASLVLLCLVVAYPRP